MDKYLSDDELMNLIDLTEQEGLINAPGDMVSNVLCKLNNEKVIDFDQKKKEYRSYCIKVVSSIAACMVLLVGIGLGKGSGFEMFGDSEKFAGEVEVITGYDSFSGDYGIVKSIRESHKVMDYYELIESKEIKNETN